MRYEQLEPIERDAAEAALVGDDVTAACDALVRLALHDSDWRWVQARCLEHVRSDHIDLRRLSATSLGHLARIHGELDVRTVMPVLRSLLKNPKTAGPAEDAIDDIGMFLSK